MKTKKIVSTNIRGGQNAPLVSIIVITYNSAKYILETLESAKNQTYQKIELIISDDGSMDSTLNICENWINSNRNRFIRTEILTTSTNSGIPANCNRGVNAANGEWVKLIAGDDIILSNCINSNITFLQVHKNINYLFSKLCIINEYGEKRPSDEKEKTHTDFFTLNSTEQYKRLVKADKIFVPAPSCFLNRKKILDLNGYDEEIPLCEDYPMWIKATKKGIKLYFFDEITVAYRIHSQSLMSEQSKKFGISMRRVFFKYRFKYLLKNNFILAIDLCIRYMVRPYPFLRKSIPYLLPLTYVEAIKKINS